MASLGTNFLDFQVGVQFPPGMASVGPWQDFCPLVLNGRRAMAHLQASTGNVVVLDENGQTVSTFTITDPTGLGAFSYTGLTHDGSFYYAVLADVLGVVGADLVVQLSSLGNQINYWVANAVGLPGMARQVTSNRIGLYVLDVDINLGFGTFISRYTKQGQILGTANISTDFYSGITFDHGKFFLMNQSQNQIEMWNGTLTSVLKTVVNPDTGTYAYSNGLAQWNRYLFVNQE